MEKFAERYRAAAFATIALATVVLGFMLLLPFVPAILWATVLSVLMFPLYRRMERALAANRFFKNGLADSVAAILAVLATLLVILIPFFLIGVGLYAQITDLAHQIGQETTAQHTFSLDTVLAQIDATVQPIATSLGMKDFSLSGYVRENAQTIVENLRQPVGQAAKSFGVGILTVVIALLTMFFLLRDGHRLREPAYELIPLPRETIDQVFARVSETVFAVFVGTVLVAIIQGTIMGITYALVGLPSALVLGVLSVILCIIPLLGAPVIYIPAGLFLLINGHTAAALWVLGIGFLVVSQIDNLLKPFFIGGRANLHPMATFFSILGGVLLFGPVGVMAGPMLLTILIALQHIIRERISLERVEATAS